MVNGNSGWPESFGFSIAGDAPVVVVAVLENSVAQHYGLNVGDQILEINDKNVRGLSKEQVTLVARRSKQVPPSLSVISRIRTFRVKRKRHVGFGMTLRGSKPVYVQSVTKNSPAFEAGICPGDMFIKINGKSVKRLDKKQVNMMIERAGNSLKLMMIAGNYAIKKFEDRFSSNSLSKYKRSREFFVKMNYYLTGEEHKKTLLIALLKRYARDRDIERFSKLLSSLLTSDVQRRLFKPVRYFIPARHQPYFDAIVNQNYARGASDSDSPRISDENSPREQATRQNGKLSRISPRDRSGMQNWQSSSTPFARKDNTPLGSWSRADGKSKSKVFPCRLVNLRRETGNSSFGFTISGCRPVFIRSVDDDGPAVVAELKPGDCIIEINGINVRNAAHESVIELLKNSGTSPTLMVQWRPLPENLEISPIRPRGQSDGSERRQNLLESNSFADSALEIDISPRNGYTENQDQTGLNASPESYQPELVKHLKEQMKKLLTRGEQLVVKQALAFFHSNRDVSKLVEALEPVLDDPLKLQMLHCISRLLPGPAQLEFEKQAVDMVARQMENGIIISATTNDHEIFDILFRVQGSKLAETDRPRNLIGGLLDVKADSSWPSSKGVSTSNSTGSLGSDLDQSPSRENGILELKETPIKDSTFDALMSIDEERLLQDSNHNRNSVVTTAVIHSTPNQRKSSLLKKNGGKGRHPDSNNNNDDVFIEEQSGEYATIIDEEGIFHSELRHPSQKDIDDLKRELLLAQEEARKAQKEAEEKGLLLENQVPGVSNSRTANGPTSIADAIKERSFDMEPDKVRSTSTDDHVILPGQFPPPGAMPPPPPPPPPAPPPPPPPPGGPGMNAMQLKRINWEKVSGLALENTVWGKLGSEDEVDGIIDFMELEQLFGTKKKPVKEKKVEKKQTSILENKKSYNLSILLGHLKMPVSELHNAVLSIDETKLTEPHIRTLLMCAPEGSETEAFKSFKGEPSSMSTADAFTVKMMSVANYTERLRAMLFKARFHDRVTEIEPDIKSVSLASEEVKSSKKLMKILEIVLATGNYMNKGSTTMSGASGFKISFLTKLISTKTSDNKSTLLHVIVNTIKNNKSELLDVKDELAHVPLAAKVSSQMLSLEISELRTGLKEINDELKNYAVKEGDNDRYKDVIGKFVKDAEKQFEDLLDSYNKMKNAFSLTTEFYSESKITTEDFFGAFAVFLQHLENVKKDVMSEEEKKEYQARKERELQEIRKRRNSTASRGRSLSNTSQPSDSEIKMGFDAVMRKRSLSQGNREGATNGVVTEFATKNSDESTIEETVILPQAESRVNAAMDMDKSRDVARSLSVNSNDTDVALAGSTRTGETDSAENRERQLAVKGSPDAIRVLPQGEPNAFAKLLKRRERIEDTDSERERADSSASDISFFSTLPRAKFKPPPALPKKKRPAPPPLKPKPRQGSIDFKSMTLPRSLSKTSSDERYDSEASKGSSSGGSSRNVPEQGNISERTWSLSSAGSARNGVADAASTGRSEINGKKIEPIAENEVAKIVNSSRTGSKGPRINGSKNNVPQSEGALKTDSLVQKETTGQDVTEDRKKVNSLVKEPIQKQTFNSSPTSNQLVVNLGPNQPTYNVDVISSDSESRSRTTSNSVKPAKPARKSTDPFKIITYEPLDSVKKPDVNGYHDSDDYDNLPPEKTAEAKMVAEDDEPDYAMPTFATDQRPEMNKNKRFEEANSSTDFTEGNHYNSLNLNNLEINNKNRENLSDNETSDGDQYSQKNKNLNNKLNRGNLFRNSSLSSSQSSESDSPKSYRKYKQNRLSTSKNKSSTMQKLKGVINGMRSRSSSEASTTSIEPVSGKKFQASLKMSPRPILKKYNQSPEHSLDIGTLDRSHSPHTVTFQDLPSASQDVMKLSTDEESLPDVSFKIPPMPKTVPPMPPPDSVPPPMPPPYHLRKDSLPLESQSSEVNNKRVISILNVEITSPPPPPFKPPPPPQKANKLTTPDELSPLSPTLPQFKPPPPPFLSKMKTATSSTKRPLPPTPPTERPSLQEALNSSPKQLGKDLEVKLNVTYKKPPPPPKRIESIKPPPPPPVRTVSPSSSPPIVESQSLGITASVSPANTVSPPSSAALIRKTMSSMSARSPAAGGSESSQNSSGLSCDIDAEFDRCAAAANFPVSAESSLEYPSPAPEVFTAPLDDIPIVPPPPASPPKAQYSSELLEEGNKRNDQSDQEQTESPRMKTLAKPNFMIKVLPTTPPLPFRENETDRGDSSGHTTDDTGTSPTTQQFTPDGSETQVRANRTDSVSSVGSVSFPPLPPSSLLDTVEEDDGRFHTVFLF